MVLLLKFFYLLLLVYLEIEFAIIKFYIKIHNIKLFLINLNKNKNIIYILFFSPLLWEDQFVLDVCYNFRIQLKYTKNKKNSYRIFFIFNFHKMIFRFIFRTICKIIDRIKLDNLNIKINILHFYLEILSNINILIWCFNYESSRTTYLNKIFIYFFFNFIHKRKYKIYFLRILKFFDIAVFHLVLLFYKPYLIICYILWANAVLYNYLAFNWDLIETYPHKRLVKRIKTWLYNRYIAPYVEFYLDMKDFYEPTKTILLCYRFVFLAWRQNKYILGLDVALRKLFIIFNQIINSWKKFINYIYKILCIFNLDSLKIYPYYLFYKLYIIKHSFLYFNYCKIVWKYVLLYLKFRLRYNFFVIDMLGMFWFWAYLFVQILKYFELSLVFRHRILPRHYGWRIYYLLYKIYNFFRLIFYYIWVLYIYIFYYYWEEINFCFYLILCIYITSIC
jgi:hypothetical protein